MDHQISPTFRSSLALLLSGHVLLLRPDLGRGLPYKVGDLDSWGIPPPSNSRVYALWSQRHLFQIGDSLLFLYPPSQDSVIQVTRAAFDACSIAAGSPAMAPGGSSGYPTVFGPSAAGETSGSPSLWPPQSRG